MLHSSTGSTRSGCLNGTEPVPLLAPSCLYGRVAGQCRSRLRGKTPRVERSCVLRHLQVHAEATDEVHRADVQQAPAEQRRRPWRNAERAHITVSQSMLLAPYSSAASQEERRWSSSDYAGWTAFCALQSKRSVDVGTAVVEQRPSRVESTLCAPLKAKRHNRNGGGRAEAPPGGQHSVCSTQSKAA